MARRRWIALAAATAGLVAPAAAHAGTYDVVACNAPGAAGANHSWTGTATAFNSAPQPEVYDIYDDCAGTEKGLVAKTHVGGSDNARFLTGAAWVFTAPSGTTITRVTVWRYGFKFRTAATGADGDPWWIGAQEANGNTVGGGFGETCDVPENQPACTIGADGGASAANQQTYDVSTTQLKWQIFCRVLSGCGRYYGGISTAGMELYGARVTLTDTSKPSLSIGGQALEAGWRRPGMPISISASDNSGIRNVRVEAGGGARSGGARSCDATMPIPCTNVPNGSLPLPAAADGAEQIRVVAEDAAGNATSAPATVLVDGTAPLARLERPRGRTLRVRVADATSGVSGGEISVGGRVLPTARNGSLLTARLDAGRVRDADVRVRVTDAAGNVAAGAPARIDVTGVRIGKRTRRVRGSHVRIPFGRRAQLRGRIVLSDGTPVAGASVAVVSRVRRPGAPLRALRTATTGARGRFAVRVPRGPSRTLGLRLARRGDVLAGSRGIGLRVPASSTIRASRRVLGGPGRVRFSGRLRAVRRGLVVILQGREAGRWRTFDDTRTDRRGRWHATYRFSGRAGSYPVRARIRRQAGYPYELGYSRAVVVRVR